MLIWYGRSSKFKTLVLKNIFFNFDLVIELNFKWEKNEAQTKKMIEVWIL